MDKKTSHEKAALDFLRATWPEFPKGKLIKSESPDFIIQKSPKTSIGIEITRIDEVKSKSMKDEDPARYLSGHSSKTPGSEMITRKQIESTIRRKEEKLVLYQKTMANEYWLIITSGMYNRGIKNRISQNAAQWQFHTIFHKLFLLILPEQKTLIFK